MTEGAIDHGNFYHFNTTVTSDLGGSSNTIVLKQKLKGNFIGSHMWQSISGHDWEDDDGDIHNKEWILGRDNSKFSHEVKVNVKYWSFFTGGDSDIEYVFQEEYPLPVGNSLEGEDNKNHLDLLTYNIYMRPPPLFVNGQSHRAELIPAKIQGYDAVCFQEVIGENIQNDIENRMHNNGYPYRSRILGSNKDLVRRNGGVIFYSKYPITIQKQILFGCICGGDDCLADKGVLYISINKNGKQYHIFGTHLDNGDRPIQQQQLDITRNFINAQNINPNEPIIITGDMNLDRHNESANQLMLRKLNANELELPIDQQFSYDPNTNILSDSDGSSVQYDHVLISKEGAQITNGFQQVRMLKKN